MHRDPDYRLSVRAFRENFASVEQLWETEKSSGPLLPLPTETVTAVGRVARMLFATRGHRPEWILRCMDSNGHTFWTKLDPGSSTDSTGSSSGSNGSSGSGIRSISSISGISGCNGSHNSSSRTSSSSSSRSSGSGSSSGSAGTGNGMPPRVLELSADLQWKSSAYPRCREGYESLTNIQRTMGLDILRGILHGIAWKTTCEEAPEYAAIFYGAVLGEQAHRRERLGYDQLLLLPAACFLHALAWWLGDDFDGLNEVTDDMITITMAVAAADRGGAGVEGIKDRLTDLRPFVERAVPGSSIGGGPTMLVEELALQCRLGDTYGEQEVESKLSLAKAFILHEIFDGILDRISPSELACWTYNHISGQVVKFVQIGTLDKACGDGDGGEGAGKAAAAVDPNIRSTSTPENVSATPNGSNQAASLVRPAEIPGGVGESKNLSARALRRG